MMLEYPIFEVSVIDFDKPLCSKGEIVGFEMKVLKVQAESQEDAEKIAVYKGYKLNLTS